MTNLRPHLFSQGVEVEKVCSKSFEKTGLFRTAVHQSSPLPPAIVHRLLQAISLKSVDFLGN